MKHLLRTSALLGPVIVTSALLTAAAFGQVAAKKDRQTERSLYQLLQEGNAKYFEGQLPTDIKIELVWKLKDEHGDDQMAQTMCIHADGALHCTIKLDRGSNNTERTIIWSTYHEACHVKIWGQTPGDYHGDAFQACMQSLALAGAFKDVW